jgi:hypothetical protein
MATRLVQRQIDRGSYKNRLSGLNRSRPFIVIDAHECLLNQIMSVIDGCPASPQHRLCFGHDLFQRCHATLSPDELDDQMANFGQHDAA